MSSKLDDSLITVAIVEDDAQVRQSLANILKRGSGVVCVGEHGNAEEAVREIPRVQPKVVLMVINLPGMDGVQITVVSFAIFSVSLERACCSSAVGGLPGGLVCC